MPIPDATELLARIRAQPWAGRLLPALEGAEPVHLVGGAVRDLLLGLEHPDVDLVVEGDAPAAARRLARALGGRATIHERFGTAVVATDGLSLDLVTARTERYPAPGALPEVRAADLDADLARRDFTVNAIAVALTPPRTGELRAAPGALEDLAAGRIRVLHPASFRDDPTRLLRAVRYETRLGFRIEPETEALARAAASGGCLDTVSGSRVRDELLDLLREPGAARGLARLAELGLDRALHPELRADPALAERALGLAPPDAHGELVALAACCTAFGAPSLRRWLERLGLDAGERDTVLAAALGAAPLAGALATATPRSAIAATVAGAPVEAVALAGALGAPEAARLWIGELRHVRLEITGADLLTAGVPQGPAVGRGLGAALRGKLDGELVGREAELRAALAAASAG